MKRGTPSHPKVLMLCSILHLAKFEAVGLLEMLWHFTARYAPQGDIGRYSDKAIAEAVGWKRPTGAKGVTPECRLSEALVEAGWLDRNPVHRLIVHDWEHHADQTLKRFLASRNLAFVGSHASPPVPVACSQKPEPEPEPHTQKPERVSSTETAEDDYDENAPTTEFDWTEFQDHYPEPKDKMGVECARKAFFSRIKTRGQHEEVILGLNRYMESALWHKYLVKNSEDWRFLPSMEDFILKGLYKDSPESWEDHNKKAAPHYITAEEIFAKVR